MERSSNSSRSAVIALSIRRLGLVGASAVLSTMLCVGGGLPSHATTTAPAGSGAPDAPATSTSPAPSTAPSSAPVASPNAPTPETTAAATQAEAPGQIDMEALRAEIGKDGAYMGQGAKDRASTFAKKSEASSLNAISTEAANTWMAPGIQGLDVSSHQPSVDWAAQYRMGARFAYVKATEGTTYLNPLFGSQYGGAEAAGMLRGAYHFAIPNVSAASVQADYFVNNGGGWTGDGKTMPPLLDIEYNPYPSLGNTCYNMSAAAMVNWITAFSSRVLARTGRLPMIYTTTDWWTQCTGNSGAFSGQPLHLASYSRDVGVMPNSWEFQSVWQYSATGPFAGDSNAWNGTYAQLQTFARSRGDSNGAIERKWLALGGAAGSLGAAVSTSDVCTLVGGGCYRSYAGGNIYWSAASGAYPVTGSYWKAWGAAGWQGGIGYPTGDVTCPYGSAASTTCHQKFQGGIIYATPGVGTFAVTNNYMSAWKEAGWQQGIGYPTAVASCGLYGGGCYQPFQKGNIYFSASTGAHAVTGPYWQAWKEAGWQQGLGYPAGPVACGLYGGGCYQPFQKANVYFSAATGAHAVLGAYFTSWKWAGWQAGVGYPTGAAKCGLYGGGCYQPFERATSYYTAATGANMVGEPYWTAWGNAGWQSGGLGYPLGVAVQYNGYREVPFQGGSIIYSPSGVTVKRK
jgi:GH25 family lysozyme M1 (1,4-beta-N-acetylmuramidase)